MSATSVIDDWIAGRIVPRRDHTPKIDIALRNVRLSARLGTLPDKGAGTSRDEFGRVFPDIRALGADEDTVGDDECWGHWRHDPSSPENRGIPGWANAWPSITVAPPSAPNDAGGTVSPPGPPMAIPVRDTSWAGDTRFVAKPVALPKRTNRLPGGWPLVVIAGTEERSQQDLGFPSGGLCVAVHYGGKSNDPLGSRVYDTTAAGQLDDSAWAREQSGRRVYVLPTSPGAGGFQFNAPGSNPLVFNPFGTVSPGAPPSELAPGGLAWQLGPTVADQAGHGACSDLPSFYAPPAPSDGDQAGGSTVSKPVAGSIAGLSQGVAAQKGVTGAGTLRITFFGGFGTSSYNVPWDGNQATIDWIYQHGEQAGFAAGGRIVSVKPVGTLSPQGPPPSSTPTTTSKPNTGNGLPPHVIALATYRAYGPHDSGGPGCPHLITATPRGENIYSLHQYEAALIRGATGDAAAKHDVTPWKPVDRDGPFMLECYRRVDVNDSHQWLTGKLAQLRKIQVSCHVATPTGYPNDGPTGTGGGTVSLEDTLSVACVARRYYPSYAQSVGITEILGRVTGYNLATDTRYQSSIDVNGFRAWNEAPVAAKIQPVGDGEQPEIDCTPYFTGHSRRGGFVFGPGDYDAYKDQRGEEQCDCNDGEAVVIIPPQTGLVFGKPTKGLIPKGWVELFTTDDTPGTIQARGTGLGGDVTSSGQLWPPTRAGELPPGFIDGLMLTYIGGGAPSLIDVSAGQCRDSTDGFDICVGDPTTDYLSHGLLANDALSSSDIGGATATLTNAAEASADTLVVLTSSAALVAALPFTSLSGLVDVSIPDANRVATMTPHAGSTTKFLSELAVGDMVGVNGVGFYCVLAIDSDSSARVMRGSVAIGDSGIARSGYAFINYGPMEIQVGGGSTASKFVAAWDGGNGFLTFGKLNGVTNGSGLNFVMGQPAPGGKTWTDAGARVYALPSWIYLWARRTTSAPNASTLTWSTQRTTPFTPATLTGYSIWRRVGVLPIDTDNFVIPFTQSNLGPSRLYEYEIDPGSGSLVTRILSNVGQVLAWTRTSMQRVVPPTSTLSVVYAEAQGHNAGPGASILYLRAANAGTAGLARSKRLIATALTVNSSEYILPTDAAQCFDYIFISAGIGANASLYVLGYLDVIGSSGGSGGGGGVGTLAGDVTGPAGSNTVAFVGGVSAANVAASTKRCSALLILGTTLAIVANATDTLVHFAAGDTAAPGFDAHGMFDPATHDERLTVQPGDDGEFIVSMGAIWAANATGSRQCYVELLDSGGSAKDLMQIIIPANTDVGNGTVIGTGGRPMRAAAGDYFRFHVFQSSGGPLSLVSSGWRTFMSVVRTGG